MLWVFFGIFFSQMHCHFIMAINNLKDGETLFKKVEQILLSFNLVGLSHYLCGIFIRLLMMLISALYQAVTSPNNIYRGLKSPSQEGSLCFIYLPHVLHL